MPVHINYTNSTEAVSTVCQALQSRVHVFEAKCKKVNCASPYSRCPPTLPRRSIEAATCWLLRQAIMHTFSLRAFLLVLKHVALHHHRVLTLTNSGKSTPMKLIGEMNRFLQGLYLLTQHGVNRCASNLNMSKINGRPCDRDSNFLEDCSVSPDWDDPAPDDYSPFQTRYHFRLQNSFISGLRCPSLRSRSQRSAKRVCSRPTSLYM